MSFTPPLGGAGSSSQPGPEGFQFVGQDSGRTGGDVERYGQSPPQVVQQVVVVQSLNERTSGMAVASMVLGILAVLTFLIPVFGFILALIGLILALASFRSLKRGGTRGFGFAITGLLTSVVGLIGGGLALVALVQVIDAATQR